MKLIAFCAVLAVCGCAAVQQEAKTPAGQLFCALDLAGGGTVDAAIVSASAAALPGSAPAAVIVTGATHAWVQAQCAAAAAATGAVGAIPVSPPANPAAVPTVAVP